MGGDSVSRFMQVHYTRGIPLLESNGQELKPKLGSQKKRTLRTPGVLGYLGNTQTFVGSLMSLLIEGAKDETWRNSHMPCTYASQEPCCTGPKP